MQDIEIEEVRETGAPPMPPRAPYTGPDEPTLPLARATLAQRRILQLLSEGNTFAEVGKPMFLSAEGVKSALRPLRGLWNAKNVTHLVAIALRNDVIE